MPESNANDRPHVVVLGAGPSGVGAAFALARSGKARVSVLEARDHVGGNAGSFKIDGVHVDYGSHRLHPACDAQVLGDLRDLLGDDLLRRPRHGRIRLRRRWIHFPLKPFDLVASLPPGFALGALGDQFRKLFPRQTAGSPTFATVLERGLGGTMCRDFYFPFSKKIWGLPPEEIAAIQAFRRVSGSSPLKILQKIGRALPGVGNPDGAVFYYPRQGYGQISQRLYETAEQSGAEFLFEARVNGLERDGKRVHTVRFEHGGEQKSIKADYIFTTLPLNAVVRGIQPQAPAEVVDSAAAISFRAMILVYLVLEMDRFTDFDAHYFPEEAIRFTRMSEPKNFSTQSDPAGVTVLCAELPCSESSPEWTMSDDQLGDLLLDTISDLGLAKKSDLRGKVRKTLTRRLRHAYPIYSLDYEEHLERIDDWVSGLEGIVTYGRQGLFAHDNTHHAIYMGYCAERCFRADGEFDRQRWSEYRREFETHVVED